MGGGGLWVAMRTAQRVIVGVKEAYSVAEDPCTRESLVDAALVLEVLLRKAIHTLHLGDCEAAFGAVPRQCDSCIRSGLGSTRGAQYSARA